MGNDFKIPKISNLHYTPISTHKDPEKEKNKLLLDSKNNKKKNSLNQADEQNSTDSIKINYDIGKFVNIKL